MLLLEAGDAAKYSLAPLPSTVRRATGEEPGGYLARVVALRDMIFRKIYKGLPPGLCVSGRPRENISCSLTPLL